jgi:hypothetical protein
MALETSPLKPCYLCGNFLANPISYDHVPPLQFYAPEIRKKHNPNLLTIPVHSSCNKGFQHDEDYFVTALAPFANESYAGASVTERIFQKYNQRENIGLVKKVLYEFDPRPSGLALPGGKMVKHFDGRRIQRISWKIVRGLYYHHSGKVLPERTPNSLKFVSPGEAPPPEFDLLAGEPIRGRYPGVFDYKFSAFPEAQNVNLWAMLLWDQIILIVTFHDLLCLCEQCEGLNAD